MLLAMTIGLLRSLAGTLGKQAHFTRASAAGDGLCGARIGVRLQVRLVLGVHAREEVVGRAAAASVRAAAAVPQADAHPREACKQQRCQPARYWNFRKHVAAGLHRGT